MKSTKKRGSKNTSVAGQEDSELHGEEIQHKDARINVAFERHEASGKIGLDGHLGTIKIICF